MTDLPYGRGGSPLEFNFKKTITKLTAFKMNEKIDSEIIYLKKYRLKELLMRSINAQALNLLK